MFEVKNLSCRRGPRVIFRDAGFCVAAGGYLSVTGANGSGESSFLRMIAGLMKPAAGAVSWRGTAIAEDRAAYNTGLRYIEPLNVVKPALTVEEMLDYWRALRGAVFSDVLDAFALRPLEDCPVPSLSAVQKKRLSLTRLMMDDTPLLPLLLLMGAAYDFYTGFIILLRMKTSLQLRKTHRLRDAL
jgi:heme exporter protein A